LNGKYFSYSKYLFSFLNGPDPQSTCEPNPIRNPVWFFPQINVASSSALSRRHPPADSRPAPRRGDPVVPPLLPPHLLAASATGWELLHCSMPSAPSLCHQGCCRQEHAGKPLVQQSSLPLMTSASLQPLADNASTPRELHMRIGALAAVLPCFCSDCDATDNHSPTSCAASHLTTLLAPRPGRTSTRPMSSHLEHA
jgi:hypothetical protein